MEGNHVLTQAVAARLTASVFGVLAGVGGVTHGVGEVRQGNVAPSGFMFNSWTEGPILTEMGGDPAMSVVPNLLVTGVLTLIVSLAVIVWAAAFVQRRHGGLVLMLLGVALLLVGGGVGSPVICLLAGAAGLRIRSPLAWWRRHLPENAGRVLAGLWPWVFGVSVLNALFLFAGALVIIYFVRLNNPDVYLNSFFFAVISVSLTLLTGAAYDARQREREAAG